MDMAHFQFQRRIPPFARRAFQGKARLRQRFASQSAGKIWLKRLDARIEALRTGGELKSMGVECSTTFLRAASAWIEQLEVEASTEEGYKIHSKRVCKSLGGLRLTAIDKAELTAYRLRRRKDKKRNGKAVGARTIEEELDIAQRILRWAKSAGYCISESAFEVEMPKVLTSRPRRYDPSVISALIAAARQGPAPSRKARGRKKPEALAKVAAIDETVIETLCRTGLRVGELRAFSVRWIRWDDRRIVVPHDMEYSPKGGKERSVPLEAGLADLLRQHLGERTSGRVFEPSTRGRPGRKGGHYRGTGIDVQKLVERVALRAEVDLTAHDLRHHAISRWVDLMPGSRYSLADVQAWAGHASIRTTELYLHQAGDRWRFHADELDRALVDSKLDSPAPERRLRVLRRIGSGS